MIYLLRFMGSIISLLPSGGGRKSSFNRKESGELYNIPILKKKRVFVPQSLDIYLKWSVIPAPWSIVFNFFIRYGRTVTATVSGNKFNRGLGYGVELSCSSYNIWYDIFSKYKRPYSMNMALFRLNHSHK